MSESCKKADADILAKEFQAWAATSGIPQHLMNFVTNLGNVSDRLARMEAKQAQKEAAAAAGRDFQVKQRASQRECDRHCPGVSPLPGR